jgi:ABC-2 type transport system ATP-binding protein
MDEADKLCDRVAIIDLGKVVALDSPKNLKKNLGGDVIKLKTSSPNIAALKKLKFVKDVKIVDGSVQITLKDASKHLQSVLNAVGIVESVEIHSPTLDDVFMHYAGKEFKERELESAEGGWAERMMNYNSRGK